MQSFRIHSLSCVNAVIENNFWRFDFRKNSRYFLISMKQVRNIQQKQRKCKKKQKNHNYRHQKALQWCGLTPFFKRLSPHSKSITRITRCLLNRDDSDRRFETFLNLDHNPEVLWLFDTPSLSQAYICIIIHLESHAW